MADRRRHFERERAIRAASERHPLPPKKFVIWVLGRLLALAVLLGAGWLVYHVAESDRFLTRSVEVQGNVLLGRAELERLAAVNGVNVFWIDNAAVEARLRTLPLVLDASVHAHLPDRVEVRIVE